MSEAMKSKRVCEESKKKSAKMKMDDGEYKTFFFFVSRFFFCFFDKFGFDDYDATINVIHNKVLTNFVTTIKKTLVTVFL
jgi:hypothetical protein